MNKGEYKMELKKYTVTLTMTVTARDTESAEYQFGQRIKFGDYDSDSIDTEIEAE